MKRRNEIPIFLKLTTDWGKGQGRPGVCLRAAIWVSCFNKEQFFSRVSSEQYGVNFTVCLNLRRICIFPVPCRGNRAENNFTCNKCRNNRQLRSSEHYKFETVLRCICCECRHNSFGK